MKQLSLPSGPPPPTVRCVCLSHRPLSAETPAQLHAAAALAATRRPLRASLPSGRGREDEQTRVVSTVSTTWCVGTRPGAPNLAELLCQDLRWEEPPSELPKMVFRVTLLQSGSNKILRADCVDVIGRSTVAFSAGACRPGPRAARAPLPDSPATVLTAFPARASLEGTAAQTRLRPQAGRALLSKVAANMLVPCWPPGFQSTHLVSILDSWLGISKLHA